MNLKQLSGGAFLSVLFSAGLLWAERVRVPDGMPVPVRLKTAIRSNQVQPGDRVDFEVARPITVQGLAVIPEGSVAWGAVQSVKRDKEIKFDVQGMRLPNLQEIKFRSVPQKTKNPGKDQIKLETMLGEVVGARMGTEFMAYLDEDVEVETTAAQEATGGTLRTAPTAAAPPAEVKAPTSAPVTPTPEATAIAAPAVTTTATPAETAPQATAQPAEPTPGPRRAVEETPPTPPAPTVSQTAQPVAPAAQDVIGTAGRITVECFSDPSGGDILIDGSYHGNTPSILKLTATSHHLEVSLPGYKNYVQDLNLSVERGFRTIRAPLEKKE
jgi:hypothetical protein